jgi:hypothetical protein
MDIRLYLREIVFGSVDWMLLTQDRDQWMDFVKKVYIKCGELTS